MKKYKLLKEYNNCNCILGDIVDEDNDYNRDNSKYCLVEFWEQIKIV